MLRSLHLRPAWGNGLRPALRLFDLPAGACLVIGVYFVLLVGVAMNVGFPAPVDELQHYSVIRAQYEQPTLFPDWSSYRVVQHSDFTRWSPAPNYINHPAIYYLLLAPLMAVGGDPLLLRLANAVLSTLALTIMVIAVQRRFPAGVVSSTWFAVIAASFPKAAVTGGLVNNDNLAAVAASMLFAGVVGMPLANWWIMAGLVVAGWTKLTAFIALAAMLFAWLGWRLIRRDLALRNPVFLFAGLGMVGGMTPYLVNLADTGHILWVNQALWRVPMADRAQFDLAEFIGYFLRSLLWKWPAAEGAYPLWIIAAALLATAGVALCGLRKDAARPVILAYIAGIAMLIAIHLVFAWRSFEALGDLTIAQTRYYNVLWPGVALAVAAGVGVLSRHWRYAGYAVAALCIGPTLIGSVLRVLV